MVEAIIALSLLALGTIGIYTLISSSLRLNRVSANQYVATKLAEEGIELVKSILDANNMEGEAWNSGVADGDKELELQNSPEYDSVAITASSNRLIKFDATNGVYNYSSGTDTPFRRIVTIMNDSTDPDKISVVSRVRWRELGGQTSEVVLEDHLFNWR